MATLNGQKQQLLSQVKNNPNIPLQKLVDLINNYDDLSVEDFKGVIPDVLFNELKEAGRDPHEVELWNRIISSPQNSMEEIIAKRKEAREAKNWDIADKIRVALDNIGIVLKDSKEGTTWEVK